jgi:exopolysaccharide biosynthesis polyprenyl glycosylphosphotransferase
MKRFNLFFSAILLPLDYLMLVLAGLGAYFIRTSPVISQWRPVLFDVELPFNRYFGIVLLVSLLWLLFYAFNGLYRIRRWRMLDEFFRIVSASSAGLMAVIIYIFVTNTLFNSRFIILTAWILAIVLVFLGRIIIRKIHDFLVAKYDFGIDKLLVIGNDKVTQNFLDAINDDPGLGLRMVKRTHVLDIAQIREAVASLEIDQILLGELNNSVEKVLDLLDLCQEKQISFKFIPNLFQTKTANLQISTIGAIPVIELKKSALDGWGRIIKRTLDILLAVILLIVFSPIMAIIAIAVKLDSEGPVIYRNLRVGQKGNFKALKFRSFYLKYCVGEEYPSHPEAVVYEAKLAKEQSLRKGPVFKVGNDPRRTKVGRFLEKWTLDELPQFWNVLKGEMSLTGPRPHMPVQVANYEKHHKKVFNIKPGITGLAQISGRSDLEFDEEAKLDIYYLENWSLGMDFKIMLKTPFVALFGRHKS